MGESFGGMGKMTRVLAYSVAVSVCFLTPLQAQDSDEDDSGGMLVNFLENTLSGDDRQIKVTGLEGALSARATIEQITVSDDQGVWLTVSGAVLDWNRLALVRGRFSVNALSAEEIIVARPPNPSSAPPDLPSPEAQPFQLPELPVAIEIGELRVDRLELGEPLIGREADLSMLGALSLADGALDSNLDIKRLDRPGDEISLIAKFSNETSQIDLDLKVIEDEGGLISTALKIPDSPPILLTAKGSGPVTDFTADITLATEDAERLTGQVRLQEVPAPAAPEPADSDTPAKGSIAFTADLRGDVTPMLPPDYHEFFGTDTALDLAGRSDPDGRLEISRLGLNSDALELDATLSLDGGGQLEIVQASGAITPPGGDTVVLPLSGAVTTLGRAKFDLTFDATKGNHWDLALTADRLTQPTLSLDHAELTGKGTLDQSSGFNLEGDLQAALAGLAFSDPALNDAVGSDIRLAGHFATPETGVLDLTGFDLRGAGIAAQMDGRISGLDSGLQMDGDISLAARDLSRFSALAGQDLAGSVEARVTGQVAPLNGTFDMVLDVTGQDLAAGIEQVDELIGGTTTVKLDAARDTGGLDLRVLKLTGSALSADASGRLASTDSTVKFSAALDDLARVTPLISGPLTFSGSGTQAGTLWDGEVSLKGPDSSYADLSGTLDPKGNADLTFDAALDKLERFVPELAGSLRASGTARRDAGTWTIDTKAEGPAQIAADVAGTFSETSGEADLTAKGQLQLGAANLFISPNSVQGTATFDLAIKGQPSLEAVSGTITTAATSLAIPAVPVTVDPIGATITLSGSQANILVNGGIPAGGGFRVSGPVALQPPFDGRLTIEILNMVLTDNISFTSSANGRLVFAGPLAGNANLSGQIEFGETDINLNAVSGAVGAAPIPEIRHASEPGAVHATRAAAGLTEVASSGSGAAIGLDIALLARKRVFATGFGLNAELAGDLRIGGSTQRVEPSGQIELIRGNLDLLGRRLKLTKGLVTLQGDLTPYVEFESATNTDDGTATIEIAGPIDSPTIQVFSEPVRPSEEALAMLLFGNKASDISPFQIAQMAASLATLRSGGGAQKKIKDETGVDTVDIGADSSGAGQIGAGAYLADNIYTDVTVNTKGETELNLNLDVTESLTIRGTVDNAGETGLGLFFQHDY